MFIKRYFLPVFFSVILFISGCQSVNQSKITAPAATGEFNFTVLKAGQADAIILQTEHHSVIIDCGEKDDGDKVLEYLSENGIDRIDYLFITHFDKDHVGGFPEVAENITPDNIAVPNYIGNNIEYEKYLEVIDENDLNVTVLTEDIHFILDDVLFEVSVPKRQSYSEGDNDFSLVISVTHGKNKFLFAGDAETVRISEVLSEFGYQHDFLKVPHHGKLHKNTKQFINTVSPSYAVICDSKKNPADDETVSLLESAGSAVYSSADGNVYVLSDGDEIKIIQ